MRDPFADTPEALSRLASRASLCSPPFPRQARRRVDADALGGSLGLLIGQGFATPPRLAAAGRTA